MNSDDATRRVMDVLGELGIPYMLVGSLSSGFYGVARSTKDADFVVQLEGASVASIAGQLGDEFRLDPQVQFETVTATTRYVIDVPSIRFHVELFRLSDDPHDQERFSRRREVHVSRFKCDAFLPTAEDVIITKLRWAVAGERGKDAEDVGHVIAVQGDAIDWDYVYGWCAQHGTRERLDQIRAAIPPIDDSDGDQ
ncbi:MAG: hypothetical protein ACE5KM_15270 [Planctomycetaceae bacterium]